MRTNAHVSASVGSRRTLDLPSAGPIGASAELMLRAWRAGIVIPAFNVPYLPMIQPIVRALCDTKCFGFIAVARLEWEKFGAKNLRAVYEEYQRVKNERYTRLHLDHVPVIDEDGLRVNYQAIIGEAIQCGYDSVMVDGSCLPLEENIAATRQIVAMAHAHGLPVEAELGAVLGHKDALLPPYEELFAARSGFTDPAEAARFVSETEADWLAVAAGNIHGAISTVARRKRKVEARLDVEHLARLRHACAVPFVLHGGTGIQKDYLQAATRNGVAKINIGTATRQPYEAICSESIARAQEAVYKAVLKVISEELEAAGSAEVINPLD